MTDQVLAWIKNQTGDGGVYATPVDGLMVLCHHRPYPITAVVYEPLVCLILQGRKETRSGSHTIEFGPGESLVVSHRMPVLSRVTEASESKPYVALVQTLDLHLLRSLEAEIGPESTEQRAAKALEVGHSSTALIDAIGRMFNLVNQPGDIAIMAPLVRKEIHFRVMTEGHGNAIRQLLRRGSHEERISVAISRIKRDFDAPLRVPELAREVGMSPSSFYSRFKALTATTPLQYQKDLRLIEARRMLSEVGESVSETAFKVGYESPTQFSREYSRKYGESPAKTRTSSVQHGSGV